MKMYGFSNRFIPSFSVVYFLELEVQLQDSLVETTFEAALSSGAVVPFLVNDSKCQVFVWGTADEPNDTSILLASRGKRLATLAAMFSQDSVSGRFSLVNQIWIKYIELVALDYLWRRVVLVVMRLIILVPLEAHLDPVEILWLTQFEVSWPV